MIQVIEAVSAVLPKYERTIFLAGGITGCPDWQAGVITELQHVPITVFNPRRKNFPIGDPNAAEEQVTWEFNKLREAEYVSFWFCKETLCPIVLFELGATMERTRKCIIGVDPHYPRRQDVEIQAKLKGFSVVYKIQDLTWYISRI